MTKNTRQHSIDGSMHGIQTDYCDNSSRNASKMPSEELPDIQTLKPTELLGELERLDYLKPATDNSQLIMPTAYKTVPTITTVGSSISSVRDGDC